MKEKLQKTFVEFLVAYAIWVLLVISKQTDYRLDTQSLLAGVVAAGLCASLFGKMSPYNPAKLFNPRRIFWFCVYLPDFIWFCFLANLDVAYRVLNISMPIRPGIVKVRTRLKSAMGKAFLANSITLTPGTLSVDIIDDCLYVHWIYVKTDDPEEQTRRIVDRFENYLLKVFD
jgi:multicomponent Na+:H+ antiporter subunit E